MLKRVTKKIKITPKIDKKSKIVLFNKKNKNIKHKNIDFSILNQKFGLLKNRFNIKMLRIRKDKGFRFFVYNLKFYFKKIFIFNFLNLIKKISNLFNNKKKNTFQCSFDKIKFKNKKANPRFILNRFIYFLTPDNKSNWLTEFKSFVFLTLASVFVINILFFSNQISKDLSRVITTTAYAKEEVISGINDIKSLDTKIAKNKFYLALNSFYNLRDDLSFLTKSSFNIFGNFINIKTSDIEEIISNLENINQASFKFVDIMDINKDKNFLFKVQKANEFLLSINKNINNIDNKISNIKTTILPLDYKNKLNDIKTKVSNINLTSDKILKTTSLLRNILGENDKKRYLLVFQNANEVRATGGFMGSYALVDIKNGEIIKTEVPSGGTYDLRGGFYENIEPPMPFRLLTDKWEIQDSNWFLDFPTSAKNISNFFEISNGGSTVNGVIAINSNSLMDLLKITGDIELKKYDIILTKDNIIDELQNIISSNRLKTNKPKEVIVDLFSVVSQKIFDIDNTDIIESISLLSKIIKEKNILAYFNDKEDQEIVKYIGFSGEILKNEQDYLSIVYSNVGASKTSQIIERKIKQNIKILPTGEVITTLKINHLYSKNLSINDRNIDYIRVYVPLGSELLSANGFSDDVVIKNSIDPSKKQYKILDAINKHSVKDINTNTIIYNDEGKTIFGNFLYLDSGDNKTTELVYKLPFNINYDKIKNNKSDIYSLLIQSQPGIKNIDFELNIKTPTNLVLSEKFILNENKMFKK